MINVKKIFIILSVAGFGAVTMSACTAQKENTNSALKVVASTTQVCDYAKEIIGEDIPIDLTCLLNANASAHEHELTSEQMRQLAQADLFIENGVGLETFLDNAVDSSGFNGTRLISSGVDAEGKHVLERAVNVEPWPFPPDEDGETFLYDPHVWMNVKNAIIQVENIGDALAELSEDNREAIQNRTAAVVESYKNLDSWIQASINTIPENNRVLFTSHDAFGYFCSAYGLTYIGTALSDFSEQNDATANHIAQAAQIVKESGTVAIFGENSNSSKSIEAIAQAAGVRAYTDEEALYGDSLGPSQTYAESMIHNVNTLVNALGGEEISVPAQATEVRVS